MRVKLIKQGDRMKILEKTTTPDGIKIQLEDLKERFHYGKRDMFLLGI